MAFDSSKPAITRLNSPRHRARVRPAFTLVELVVSITVGVIITGIAATLILNASRQRMEVAARGELIDMGSAAIEVMLRYIREISQDECPLAATPCLNGNAQVTTAADSDLRFDTYGFRLNAGKLEITKNSGTNWHTLATGVTGLAFTYYDRNNAALSPRPLSLANRNAIRRISIQLDLASGSETTRLRTSIFLRNFMNEVTSAP